MEGFDALQRPLADVWPSMTLKTIRPQLRTVIVVHSLPSEILPPHLGPVYPAYEERFLCLVLSLLRAPGSRVVYVTSQPILPEVVDYWFGLVRDLDTPEARSRLFLVSPVDGSPRPLAAKILERPRLLQRIRSLVVDPQLAIVVPFICGVDEARLALALGVPIYGSHPRLWDLGSKSNGRRLFRELDVPVPPGVEDVRTRDDLRSAIAELRRIAPDAAEAIVKLDQGAGGLGNATLSLSGDADTAIDQLKLEDGDGSADVFLATLERDGGVVEARLTGTDFQSPSVQLRASPTGLLEVLSTHDQALGGPQGLTFLGARFPADPAYGPMITAMARTIGERLCTHGVIGRLAIDFVVVRDGEEPWRAYALEINLRAGGTSHPFMALQALTDGTYDPDSCTFIDVHGRPRFYVASDHLEAEAYRRLTPLDFFDILGERGVGWDEPTMTGCAFHMVSALAVAGRVGITAVGQSPAHAEALMSASRTLLDEESGRAGPF